MSAWRQAGLNYINYSNIAAKLLRQALKPESRADALKRGDTHIKITKWADGKPIRVTGEHYLLCPEDYTAEALAKAVGTGLNTKSFIL